MKFRLSSFLGFMVGILIVQTTIHIFESWKHFIIFIVLAIAGIIWGFIGDLLFGGKDD